MKKLINKILFFILLFLIITAIVFLPKKNGEGKVQELSSVYDGQVLRSLRCGINSLYFALRYLTNESGLAMYQHLGEQFPDVEKNGMNLKQIENYLQGRGFFCHFTKLNGNVIDSLSDNTVVFLLKEQEPVSHILLLLRKGENKFQLLDSAVSVPQEKTLQEAKTLNYYGLCVAKRKEELPQESFFVKHLFPAFLLFFGLILIIFPFLKFRRNDVPKT